MTITISHTSIILQLTCLHFCITDTCLFVWLLVYICSHSYYHWITHLFTSSQTPQYLIL